MLSLNASAHASSPQRYSRPCSRLDKAYQINPLMYLSLIGDCERFLSVFIPIKSRCSATWRIYMYIIKGDMFVCLSVMIYVPYGRPNGWADRDETWRTHSCPPRECFWQGQCQGHSRMRAELTEIRNTRKATPGERRITVLTLRPDDGRGDN